MIRLTIDNRELQVLESMTVLEAARSNNIAIPTLCYHQAVAPYAACRMCVVEIQTPPRAVEAGGGKPSPDRKGRIVAACTQLCEEGMCVLTNSPRVQAARRVNAELLLASGAHLPVIQSLAQSVGATQPATSLAPNDCVLCGLCVRACDELVGAHAISLVARGLEKQFAPPFQITSASCISCATCVLICPSGAITLQDITPIPHSAHDARTCRVCGEASVSPRFADVERLMDLRGIAPPVAAASEEAMGV
jgi:NADH dehydrogenase/NADH:ubiquinone oxidoreductase subunit G